MLPRSMHSKEAPVKLRVMKRLVALLVLPGLAQGADATRLGFERPIENGLPAGWRHVAFPSISKMTSYAMVTFGDVLVVQAKAKGSASVVVRAVTDTGE